MTVETEVTTPGIDAEDAVKVSTATESAPPAVKEEAEVEVSSDEKPEAKDPPAYQPNYQYKANDAEKEFPDFVRGAVTSKEVEEQLRDIFSRADGLPTVKEKLSAAEERLAAREQEFGKVVKGLEVLEHYAKNDFSTFLEKAKIPKQVVMDTVKQWMAYESASPEERRRHDNERHVTQQSYELQQSQHQLKQQLEAQTQQNLQYQLDMAMLAPEVSQASQAFDGRAGRAGAFRDEVIKEFSLVGQNRSYIHNTPQDAAKSVIGRYQALGVFANNSQQAQSTSQADPPPKPLPNVGSGRATASPTRKVWKSIDEMRKDIDRKFAAS